MANIQQLFGQLNFATLADNPDFKEDSVREVIILPILKALGYTQENIVRSKTLEHPFMRTGSRRRTPVKLIPDYLLKVENNFAWVLDAKAPNKRIVDDDNVEQVYSYAIHPEIRTTYFTLCNGIAFSLFRSSSPQQPILFFSVADIEDHWEKLAMYLSPDSFQIGKNFTYDIPKKQPQFDYANRPLLEEIPVKKQAAKRHFGVHGYFTKQSWNVVQEYIKNYTKPGDLVLDPFGGSGITVVEALMTGRKGINIDLNPMAVFIVQSLMAPVKLVELAQAFEEVKIEYLSYEPKTKEEIDKALKKYKGCKVLPLPRGSDVETTDQLFSNKQMAQLGLLKSIILKQKNGNIRKLLLLMFSGLVTKINLTYHQSSSRSEGGGDASVFRYYRYRIAPNPVDIDIMKYFELRYKKVRAAKQEMSYFINEETISRDVLEIT